MPDGEVAGARLDGVVAEAVGAEEVLVGRRVLAPVDVARRERAEQIAEDRHDVGLVDGARHPDEVAEVLRGALGEAGEVLTGLGVQPSAFGDGPPGGREVVVGEHGEEAVLVARGEHAPVVVERVDGELARFGLDAGPLEREPVRGESEVGEERDVFRVAPEVVARVAGDVDARRRRIVFPHPPVVVPVASFDLVRSRGRAPDETVGKGDRHDRGA